MKKRKHADDLRFVANKPARNAGLSAKAPMIVLLPEGNTGRRGGNGGNIGGGGVMPGNGGPAAVRNLPAVESLPNGNPRPGTKFVPATPRCPMPHAIFLPQFSMRSSTLGHACGRKPESFRAASFSFPRLPAPHLLFPPEKSGPLPISAGIQSVWRKGFAVGRPFRNFMCLKSKGSA